MPPARAASRGGQVPAIPCVRALPRSAIPAVPYATSDVEMLP
jgi:hypothetical protein